MVGSAGMARRISKKDTRKVMIDPQFEQAGWYLRDHAKVKIEIPVDGYDAEQIRFLRAVQSVLLEKRKLEAADLYEPPLTNFGADAVEKWFTEKEVKEVIKFANRMAV